MIKSKTIFIMGVALLILIFLSGLFIFGKRMFGNNIEIINDIECARNQRITTNLPFCSLLKQCLEDCKDVGGEFLKVRGGATRSDGNVCFCTVGVGTQNLW